MKNFLKQFSPTLLAPVIFAVYPVFALWAANFDKVKSVNALSLAVYHLIWALIGFGVLRLVYRNTLQAGLAMTFLLIMYFSYGHIYNLLEEKALLGLVIGRHRYLIVGWLLVGIGGMVWITRKGEKAATALRLANIIGGFLLAFVIVQVSYAGIRDAFMQSQNQTGRQTWQGKAEDLKPLAPVGDKQNWPDVYYIILDSYTREDVLREEFNYQDPLPDKLRSKGFVLPPCTQANYSRTALSMSATLNMGYLEDFAGDLDRNAPELDYGRLTEAIRHSRVRQYFQSLGYQFVTFENEFTWVNIKDSDVFIRPPRQTNWAREIFEETEFNQMLNQTTLLRFLDEAQAVSPVAKQLVEFLDEQQAQFKKLIFQEEMEYFRRNYDRAIYEFSQLETVSKMPGKKFVYLHIMLPHYPFVFGPDGKFTIVKDGTDPAGYLNQVKYLNARVPEIVDTILKNSATPPVIILQGDHGWRKDHDPSLRVLNAYYLPDNGGQKLYKSITPVNTFRLIFNTYFGGNFEMQPDKSFFSGQGYNLEPVPFTCSDGQSLP
jgi:hypothetical protein